MLINPNNFKLLADTLEDIIGTPVSDKLVEVLTDKQRSYLTSLIFKWKQGQKVEEVIKSILDNGKKRMPSHFRHNGQITKLTN